MPSIRSVAVPAVALARFAVVALFLTAQSLFSAQAQATVQLLLATCDYVGALDVISTTKEVLRDELTGVTCVRYVLVQGKDGAAKPRAM